MSENKVSVGDWVRFMKDNRLIIGKVEYCLQYNNGRRYLTTDQGEIDIDSVREVRKVGEK